MDRHMDRLGKMNSMTLSPFFRADHRRAVDGVIAYFGDSLASASPPATLAFRGAAGDKTSQPLMPWLGNAVMGCRMPCELSGSMHFGHASEDHRASSCP